MISLTGYSITRAMKTVARRRMRPARADRVMMIEIVEISRVKIRL